MHRCMALLSGLPHLYSAKRANCRAVLMTKVRKYRYDYSTSPAPLPRSCGSSRRSPLRSDTHTLNLCSLVASVHRFVLVGGPRWCPTRPASVSAAQRSVAAFRVWYNQPTLCVLLQFAPFCSVRCVFSLSLRVSYLWGGDVSLLGCWVMCVFCFPPTVFRPTLGLGLPAVPTARSGWPSMVALRHLLQPTG